MKTNMFECWYSYWVVIVFAPDAGLAKDKAAILFLEENEYEANDHEWDISELPYGEDIVIGWT